MKQNEAKMENCNDMIMMMVKHEIKQNFGAFGRTTNINSMDTTLNKIDYTATHGIII